MHVVLAYMAPSAGLLSFFFLQEHHSSITDCVHTRAGQLGAGGSVVA